MTCCCGAHSLAEVYSTLTRMPEQHRISGEQASLFIGSIRERITIIALNREEYADTLRTPPIAESWETQFTLYFRIKASVTDTEKKSS